MDYLERTRDGYDATAVEYARRFHRHLDDKPVELAMLSAFAGLVKTTGGLAVADVGCGTGATTAILHQLGTSPTGIDLSPNMIAEAQRLNRDIEFSVGSMTTLPSPTRPSAVSAPGTPSFTYPTTTYRRYSTSSTAC